MVWVRAKLNVTRDPTISSVWVKCLPYPIPIHPQRFQGILCVQKKWNETGKSFPFLFLTLNWVARHPPYELFLDRERAARVIQKSIATAAVVAATTRRRLNSGAAAAAAKGHLIYFSYSLAQFLWEQVERNEIDSALKHNATTSTRALFVYLVRLVFFWQCFQMKNTSWTGLGKLLFYGNLVTVTVTFTWGTLVPVSSLFSIQ